MVNLSTKSLQVHHTYVKKRELQIQIIFEVIWKKNHINNDNNKNHFLEPNSEIKKQSTFFFVLLIS